MATDVVNQAWYYIRDRKKIGPVPWDHLRNLAAAGQLRPADMVLPGGATHWMQALAVDGLFPLPNTLASQGPPPLPAEATDSLPTNQLPTAAGAATLSRAGMTQWSGSVPALPGVPGYTLLGELGRGGMGVVYKAEQVKLKRLVALKMVLGGMVAGAQQLGRFRAEAEAVARLRHANIVQIYEVGEHDGLPYFSLEYCAGGSLSQRLDGTPLPAREAAVLVEKLARAMHAAHERHIVHRDLKPGNVLLDADGTPKITDFGLAKKMDATEAMTQSGAVMGTPSYMAPEQARGQSRDLGPSADIYALGAMLYELLTGRPPFKGATAMETMVQVVSDEPVPPSRLQPKLPPDLETVCLKCLEKAPARRYATAQALADDLHRFLAGEPIQARPAGRWERGWKWARRRPALAGLLAVSALALLSILAGILYFTVRLGRERNVALEEKATAEKERARAENNETKARQQEEEVKRQKEVVEQERKRAVDGEADARQKLDLARRSLFTAQVWRVAGLLERDPIQALELLQEDNTCPQDLRDFSWRYFNTLCRQARPLALTGHRGGVHAVAVSPDGKTLASGAGDGTVKLWELATRKERATLRGHIGPVHTVAFSPDGALLASGGLDRTIKMWDVATAKEVGLSLKGHTGGVYALAFSPDGQRLVSGSGNLDPTEKKPDDRMKNGEVRLWNVTDHKEEKVLLPLQKPAILCVAFSPDGRTVAAGSTCNGLPGSVFMMDATTGHTSPFSFPSGSWIQAIRFSPDGRTLAIGTSDHLVHLRDVAGNRTRLSLGGHQNEVASVAWSPDGKTLASGDESGRIILWNTLTGKERLTLTYDASIVSALAYTPDGSTLVAGHRSAKLTTWELVPRPAVTYPGPTGYGAVALTADSRTLAVATRAQTVGLWNLATGQNRTIKLGRYMGKALAFSPDGDLLAVGAHACQPDFEKYLPGGECQLWDVATEELLGTIKSADQPVTAVAFTLDGRTLILGDGGGKVRWWDMAEQREADIPPGTHSGAVLALALSPDGRTLASAGDTEIKLWDVERRREKVVCKRHPAPVTGLGFLDKGRTLVSADRAGNVHLWDVAAGTWRTSVLVQQDEVLSLAVSKDEQTLALGCQDRTVKLWDVRSAQLRAVFSGHTREVNALAFSRDGRFLVSASAANAAYWVRSGEVKVWKADE